MVDLFSLNRSVTVQSLRDRVQNGQQVKVPAALFLVRRPRQEVGATAGIYVKCELGDETGWVETVWWGAGKVQSEELQAILSAQVWEVEGVASVYRAGSRVTPQLRVDRVRAGLGIDPLGVAGLVRRSASTERELEEWLSARISEVRNQPLRRLLEDTLGEQGAWRAPFLRAPAGLHYHHAYVGGLADHVREMASTWLASHSIFPKVDRDLTLAGILLHDVGKLDSYMPGPAPQIACSGRFTDHITSGIARLSLAMATVPDFPPLLRDHLLHILASHHGAKEHGSPVIPATREALVVHHLDRLTSLLSHLEEWTRQSGVDQFGWTTDYSPWLKVKLASSPGIPGAADDGELLR